MFEQESAKVEIQTSIYADETAIYELPVKNASVVTNTDGSKQFKYTLDGLKTATKEFFYNRNDLADSRRYDNRESDFLRHFLYGAACNTRRTSLPIPLLIWL